MFTFAWNQKIKNLKFFLDVFALHTTYWYTVEPVESGQLTDQSKMVIFGRWSVYKNESV